MRKKSKIEHGWTPLALDCFYRGCRCSTCYIPSLLSVKCKMKEAVLRLCRETGKPPRYPFDPLKEEVFNFIQDLEVFQSSYIVQSFDISGTTIYRILAELCEEGLLSKLRKGKNVYYVRRGRND